MNLVEKKKSNEVGKEKINYLVDEINIFTCNSMKNAKKNSTKSSSNGKKTKGRLKLNLSYINNKNSRSACFCKRKSGLMKKAHELSVLTGTQVMLLIASETGHVYTFATDKLQPMITSERGKTLIQTCLNSPDNPSITGSDVQYDVCQSKENNGASLDINTVSANDLSNELSSPYEST